MLPPGKSREKERALWWSVPAPWVDCVFENQPVHVGTEDPEVLPCGGILLVHIFRTFRPLRAFPALTSSFSKDLIVEKWVMESGVAEDETNWRDFSRSLSRKIVGLCEPSHPNDKLNSAKKSSSGSHVPFKKNKIPQRRTYRDGGRIEGITSGLSPIQGSLGYQVSCVNNFDVGVAS